MDEETAIRFCDSRNGFATRDKGFLAELTAARRAGVTLSANLPFLLFPKSAPKTGVLLVHGFSASPREMYGVGERLAEAGYVALGVRLPGHGTSPADLRTRRFEEWLQTVADGERLLAQYASRIYGIGLSTGAMLLLALTAQKPLAGLVLLSPFLRLQHPLAPLSGFVHFLHPYQQRPVSGDQIPYYYSQRPLAGVHQILRLVRHVRRELAGIETPTLMICGDGDQTARVDSAIAMFRRLGSRRKVLHLFGPEVPHVLTTEENPRLEETLSLILGFLADSEGTGGRGEEDDGRGC